MLQSVNLHIKNAKWVWGPEQQHAFDCLKACIATPEVMKYFNSSLKPELIVDASSVGLGAILTQVTGNGGTNIVAYASHSLTDCKSCYSQTEREALAVVWETEHFHLYLYGSSFQIITDHKPLETIFNNPTCKATARLQKLQLCLQPYKTKMIFYRPFPSGDYLLVVTDDFSLYPEVGNCEEELPKKPVGRLSVNCRPTVGRQLVVCRPTVGRLSAVCRPTDGQQVLPET